MPISEIFSWGLTVLDKDRISKNKADILSIRLQIEEITGMGKEAFLQDKRNPLSLKYLLIEAVEAITEVCQHILARTKGVSCSGYIDCIVKAGEKGIITAPLSSKLRRLADLRNSLIHRYWIINDEQLYDICRENTGDFGDFLIQIGIFMLKLPPVAP